MRTVGNIKSKGAQGNEKSDPLRQNHYGGQEIRNSKFEADSNNGPPLCRRPAAERGRTKRIEPTRPQRSEVAFCGWSSTQPRSAPIWNSFDFWRSLGHV